MRGKSKALKTRQDKDCTMSNHTSEAIQLKLPLFATVGSVPQNSEMISMDKSPICNPSTQTQKSLKILAQDSTSEEKVCAPYWTDFCKEINLSLLLPVGTDSQDLDLNLCNIWSNKTMDKSWFLTKLYTVHNQNLPKWFGFAHHKIYSQSFTSFPIECTDLENTLKKSKKIYLKLSPTQKRKIKYWFGVSRFKLDKLLVSKKVSAYTTLGLMVTS